LPEASFIGHNNSRSRFHFGWNESISPTNRQVDPS
jgi:hypothetical protein